MATFNFGYPVEGVDLIDGETTYTAAMFTRDWTVTDANLAGALKIIGPGVVRDTADSFKVTAGTGLSVSIAPGKAVLNHTTEGVAYVELNQLITLNGSYVPVNRSAGNPIYLFVVPEDVELKDGRPDFAISNTSTYDGGVLLATITTNATTVTAVTDSRVFSKYGTLDIHGMVAKPSVVNADEVVIWDSVSNGLKKVTIASLLAGVEGSDVIVTQLSQLIYNTDHAVQADTYIDSRFGDVEEAILELQGGAKKFPEASDLQMDLSAALAVGLFEVNPTAVLRTQMAALGRGFGRGQNSTPNFSPNTGQANEATYDTVTGLIKP